MILSASKRCSFLGQCGNKMPWGLSELVPCWQKGLVPSVCQNRLMLVTL